MARSLPDLYLLPVCNELTDSCRDAESTVSLGQGLESQCHLMAIGPPADFAAVGDRSETAVALNGGSEPARAGSVIARSARAIALRDSSSGPASASPARRDATAPRAPSWTRPLGPCGLTPVLTASSLWSRTSSPGRWAAIRPSRTIERDAYGCTRDRAPRCSARSGRRWARCRARVARPSDCFPRRGSPLAQRILRGPLAASRNAQRSPQTPRDRRARRRNGCQSGAWASAFSRIPRSLGRHRSYGRVRQEGQRCWARQLPRSDRRRDLRALRPGGRNPAPRAAGPPG